MIGREMFWRWRPVLGLGGLALLVAVAGCGAHKLQPGKAAPMDDSTLGMAASPAAAGMAASMVASGVMVVPVSHKLAARARSGSACARAIPAFRPDASAGIAGEAIAQPAIAVLRTPWNPATRMHHAGLRNGGTAHRRPAARLVRLDLRNATADGSEWPLAEPALRRFLRQLQSDGIRL